MIQSEKRSFSLHQACDSLVGDSNGRAASVRKGINSRRDLKQFLIRKYCKLKN